MSTESYGKGRVTLPVEVGKEDSVAEVALRLGADAIRDSDGTEMPASLAALDYQVYSTVCLIRHDQEWNKKHPDHIQARYIMSLPVTAAGNCLKVGLMDGLDEETYAPDWTDPQKYWEVMDRTAGEACAPRDWSYDRDAGTVTITNATPWHVYTVSFLAYQIWERVSRHNYITNHWSGEHKSPIDPRYPETRAHLIGILDQWLADHPRTNTVRITSIAYQFGNIFRDDGGMLYGDWYSYHDMCNRIALDEFERIKGYRLIPEDFIDNGYYHTACRIPSPEYRDWMQVQHDFVTAFSRDVCDHIHAAGKKAMLFFCDHWVGTEPYSERFKNAGWDAIVSPVAHGMMARRNADVPAPVEKEIRLFPYFFPDVFRPGGDPKAVSQNNWVKIRRALARTLVDRIGWGGYLSLALEFPDFMDHLAALADEFREMHNRIGASPPYVAPVKVAVLNCWGRLRAWMENGYEMYYLAAVYETLSGLPVEIAWINFDEIRAGGIPDDIDVIINVGEADTAWSGGYHWTDAVIQERVRAFVDSGGGLVGIGDPTAHEFQGRFFQLADVLGVQKETGRSRSYPKPGPAVRTEHFILADTSPGLDLGHHCPSVYAYTGTTDVLALESGHVRVATNGFGAGRAVYFAALAFSWENVRLFHRALFWAAHREDAFDTWRCANPATECAYFPQKKSCFVYNNTAQPQDTVVFHAGGSTAQVSLDPYASCWIENV